MSTSVCPVQCWMVASCARERTVHIGSVFCCLARGQVDLVVCEERHPGGSRLLVGNRWKIVVLADTGREGSQRVYEI